MKFLVNKRLVYLTGIFLILLVFQLIMHPVFLLRYFERSCAAGWMEVLSVPLYGIRLDVVIASYLSAIPLVVLLTSLISSALCPILSWILKVYYIIVAILLSAIFTIDLELFGFWDFRFDASVLLYMQKPREAVASIGLGTIVLYTSFFILSASLLIFALLRFHRRYFSSAAVSLSDRLPWCFCFFPADFCFWVCAAASRRLRPMWVWSIIRRISLSIRPLSIRHSICLPRLVRRGILHHRHRFSQLKSVRLYIRN
ncbi:hypothetical protein [Porphyromonas macacae]|uniref:hypothetical protein n=1 Tax=Porphyromonas macacae TaxID=28115 RepID=UPI000685BD42|nr:hypothetical protein [Porphyromonas macacae]